MYATIFSLQHFFQLSIKSVAAVADGVVVVVGGGIYVCMYACMLICHTCTHSCTHTCMCLCFGTRSYVVQPVFKLHMEPRMAERLFLLLLPPLYWDYRCGPPDLAAFEYMKCCLTYILKFILFS